MRAALITSKPPPPPPVPPEVNTHPGPDFPPREPEAE